MSIHDVHASWYRGAGTHRPRPGRTRDVLPSRRRPIQHPAVGKESVWPPTHDWPLRAARGGQSASGSVPVGFRGILCRRDRYATVISLPGPPTRQHQSGGYPALDAPARPSMSVLHGYLPWGRSRLESWQSRGDRCRAASEETSLRSGQHRGVHGAALGSHVESAHGLPAACAASRSPRPGAPNGSPPPAGNST